MIKLENTEVLGWERRRQVPPDDRGDGRYYRTAVLVEGVRHL